MKKQNLALFYVYLLFTFIVKGQIVGGSNSGGNTQNAKESNGYFRTHAKKPHMISPFFHTSVISSIGVFGADMEYSDDALYYKQMYEGEASGVGGNGGLLVDVGMNILFKKPKDGRIYLGSRLKFKNYFMFGLEWYANDIYNVDDFYGRSLEISPLTLNHFTKNGGLDVFYLSLEFGKMDLPIYYNSYTDKSNNYIEQYPWSNRGDLFSFNVGTEIAISRGFNLEFQYSFGYVNYYNVKMAADVNDVKDFDPYNETLIHMPFSNMNIGIGMRF